jgi:hypothetical protein
MMTPWWLWTLSALVGGNPAAPPSPGVVFFAPSQPAAAVAELEKLHADGYSLIEFASWCWTLPKPGSPLEHTAGAVLDWCDDHDVRFVLMHNIQLGSRGEGGGLDDAATDPLRAGRFLTDWLRVLHGHRCVAGIILGNEVAPVTGNPHDTPRWWAGFLDDLRARHATIAALNAAWGTTFADFAAITPPAAGSPGDVDLQRYAVHVFDRFYGTLFEELCVPALGHLLYGAKAAGDPLLQRTCESFTTVCWDDALADYPQWRAKALGDVAALTGKPAFNAELHLYHDFYAYGGSPAKSRYRYLLSVLNGEQLNASFAWGQWTKPAAQAMHRATPGILADLARLAPALQAMAAAPAEMHVLLSGPTASDDAAAQRLYTEVAGLGRAWRYVCPQDISSIKGGLVVLPAGTRLAEEQWRGLAVVPPDVTLVALEPVTLSDQYGRPLSGMVAEAVGKRLHRVAHLTEVVPTTLDGPYAETIAASYLDWSPKRGHFHYPLTYPKLEARRVRDGDGWLVAVINHATDGAPVTAPLPWLTKDVTRAVELPAGEVTPLAAPQTFAPLAVRLWRYEGR